MARKKARKRDAEPGTGATLAALGAVAVGVGAIVAGLFAWNRSTGSAEHAAPDLALDKDRPGAGDRAPVAFRPDPTAPVSAAERESLRPATGPSSSIVADRGEMRSQTAPANG